MRARLGINNCFAVKRWPRPGDWAQVVREELGLDLVELSLDLIEETGIPSGRQRAADEIRAALDQHGITANTMFTGLRAYSLNLLMHPDPGERRSALDWYLGVVDLTARAGRWAGLKRDLAEIAGVARAAGLDYLLIENLASHREPSAMDGIRDLLTDGDVAHDLSASVTRWADALGQRGLR